MLAINGKEYFCLTGCTSNTEVLFDAIFTQTGCPDDSGETINANSKEILYSECINEALSIVELFTLTLLTTTSK